ncbi:MAG: hypothetical protein Q8S24_03255 [Eubacteriales bacterium]|nr:hypothetical protein [Eubacteriales bacterium]
MNNRKILILVIILVVSLIGPKLISTEATISNNDPLISLSYLNKVIDELKATLNLKNEQQDDAISTISTQVSQVSSATGNVLEVVELYANTTLLNNAGKSIVREGQSKVLVGTKIIADAGTEIILRYTNGSTTAIASNLGGLSNVTEGYDIQHGKVIPANHLLIIPRSDGRGVAITNNAIFMIRGSYRVE